MLVPLSWIMRGVVGLRNKAFEWGILRTTRLEIPVLSVGNLVVGGAGKTPMVQYLTGLIHESGRIPGVVSRGYRRTSSGVLTVSDGRGTIAGADEGGDEPVQVARRFPEAIVVVGERRVEAAKEAVRLGAEVIVLDDAYQHRSIGRDLNLLVMDGSTDLSKEALLPAGRLREPVSSIARADVVAVSNAPDPSSIHWLVKLERSKPVVCFAYEAGRLRSASDGMKVESLPAGPVLAFSGIAHHENFLRTLRSTGVTIGDDLRFRDHHSYRPKDFQTIIDRMRAGGLKICVTTEKDYVRIDGFSEEASRFCRDAQVMYVPVSLVFTRGESMLRSMVTGSLS